MSNLEEINPELFIYELYSCDALAYLDPHDLAVLSIGYCDAGRLAVRPRPGLLALMIEYPNGEKCWFHIEPKSLELLNKRRNREKGDNDGSK